MTTVAVDTGGTFTDVILRGDSGLEYYKLLSTPRDPGQAVRDGMKSVAHETDVAQLIHGTTVATNALLERRGARTAFVTTAGFEDLLTIGRQARPDLYALEGAMPKPIIAKGLCFGASERIRADATVETPLEPQVLQEFRQWLKRKQPESVAVCLLHAYANPEHERALGEVATKLGIPVSLSSDVLPEFREVERASTTVVNAYVMPKMADYIGRLDTSLPKTRVSVMQSNGGRLRAGEAQEQPVHTILSGPAGGVVGARAVADAAGFERIVTFDMGGTSTDVALCDGQVPMVSGRQVGESTVAVPMIDIHTVGAGGGSIASIDVGGALRVGPESAGADPGPACYGRGADVAVTDAHLWLGRLDAERFLGGRMRIERNAISRPLGGLAKQAHLSRDACAQGIIDVANANMERAIRVTTVERGHDPRDFTLVGFGGAGGLHVCDLTRLLGFHAAVVPRNPGLLSALGMLHADVIKDFSHTVLAPMRTWTASERKRAYGDLERAARRVMREEGFGARHFVLERQIDLRYVGQSYELTVAEGAGSLAAFHALHERRYGHADVMREVEIVTVRVRASATVEKPELPRIPRTSGGAKSAQVATQQMICNGKLRRAAVYGRELLRAGHHFAGPALVTEMSGTTVVLPGFHCRVDTWGNLVLRER